MARHDSTGIARARSRSVSINTAAESMPISPRSLRSRRRRSRTPPRCDAVLACSAAASASDRCSSMRAASCAACRRRRSTRLLRPSSSCTPIRSCTTTYPRWTTTTCAAAVRPRTAQFDEAIAILAGDALQALAFEILCDEPALAARPERQIKVIRRLARAVGPAGHGRRPDARSRGRGPAPRRGAASRRSIGARPASSSARLS